VSSPRLCSDGPVMGLFKQLMIFGKTGLQGLSTRLFHVHGILWQVRGEPQYLETFRAGADQGIILSALVAQLVGRLGSDGQHTPGPVAFQVRSGQTGEVNKRTISCTCGQVIFRSVRLPQARRGEVIGGQSGRFDLAAILPFRFTPTTVVKLCSPYLCFLFKRSEWIPAFF